MLMVISNENIIRVYRIFLKIMAIGMGEVRKGVVCSPTTKQFRQYLKAEDYQ
jgi:hypothetical protein